MLGSAGNLLANGPALDGTALVHPSKAEFLSVAGDIGRHRLGLGATASTTSHRGGNSTTGLQQRLTQPGVF